MGTPTTGSDFGGGSQRANQLVWEVECLVDAGLEPWEVLAAATRRGGRVIGDAEAGIVRVGGPADFVLVHGDPLSDPRITLEGLEGSLGGLTSTPAPGLQRHCAAGQSITEIDLLRVSGARAGDPVSRQSTNHQQERLTNGPMNGADHHGLVGQVLAPFKSR